MTITHDLCGGMDYGKFVLKCIYRCPKKNYC